MKDAIEFLAWTVGVVALSFLVAGDPDLFDIMREAAIRYFSGVCR